MDSPLTEEKSRCIFKSCRYGTRVECLWLFVNEWAGVDWRFFGADFFETFEGRRGEGFDGLILNFYL